MDILFYIYLACFIVGGVVVLLSALGGAGGDMGVDADAVDLGESLGLLSFLSTRKVFFFGCFFGLMGLVGGLVMGTLTTLLVSLGVGALCAWLGNLVLRHLADSSYSVRWSRRVTWGGRLLLRCLYLQVGTARFPVC